MPLLLCPGIHPSELTQGFWRGLVAVAPATFGTLKPLILPTVTHAPYSPWAVRQFLKTQGVRPPESLAIVAFSAGVVGAVGLAAWWQHQGGTVQALVAVDGWGVPLCPLGGGGSGYRVSHDRFTHRSSALLGAGGMGFYCDPPVAHRDLWQAPHRAEGWVTGRSSIPLDRATAATFVIRILQSHGIGNPL